MGQAKSKNPYTGESSVDVSSPPSSSLFKGGILDIGCNKNNILACCSEDKSICLFDWEECIRNYSKMKRTYLHGHEKAVNAICLRNQKLFSVSRDLTIRIWDLNSNSLSSTLKNAHELNVVDVTVTQDEKRFVTGSRDYSVKLWDTESLSLMKTYSSPRNVVTCVSFGPDEALFYQGSEDLTVRVFDSRSSSREPVKQLVGYTYFPISIDIHCNGNYLATG